MNLPEDDHLEIGLNNRQRIFHQLYNLVITKVETHEELERSWKILVQEEEREILWRQRRDEQQDQRNQRLASALEGQGHD
jgi:hypothetical protein